MKEEILMSKHVTLIEDQKTNITGTIQAKCLQISQAAALSGVGVKDNFTKLACPVELGRGGDD